MRPVDVRNVFQVEEVIERTEQGAREKGFLCSILIAIATSPTVSLLVVLTRQRCVDQATKKQIN